MQSNIITHTALRSYELSTVQYVVTWMADTGQHVVTREDEDLGWFNSLGEALRCIGDRIAGSQEQEAWNACD